MEQKCQSQEVGEDFELKSRLSFEMEP